MGSIFRGVVFALGACFVWGLIFVVPQFMQGFSSIEVSLGRYLFYGIISLPLLLRGFYTKLKFPLVIWLKSLYFSLMATMVYYTALVLALRYASPAVCALILGISPITTALYGSFKEKEYRYKNLIIPSVLLIIGLVFINLPYFSVATSAGNYMWGLFFSFVALLSWSWFVVTNSEFLKKNPEITANQWSTLMGVSTLFWVLLCFVVVFFFFRSDFKMDKYFTLSPMLSNFLIGAGILGFICSWLGAFLWNKACFYLPSSLLGQLTIFETVFGFLFVALIDKRMPPMIEILGICFLLGSIIYGLRIFSGKTGHETFRVEEVVQLEENVLLEL